jgi:hypothetical protein
VSHNIHFSGAIMRVTEGLGPTSLRDSSFVNNTATAVLRFEGRTWVLKTDTFFAGIQFLDVLFYTQFQGASKAAYTFAELQHAQQQVGRQAAAPLRKRQSSTVSTQDACRQPAQVAGLHAAPAMLFMHARTCMGVCWLTD